MTASQGMSQGHRTSVKGGKADVRVPCRKCRSANPTGALGCEVLLETLFLRIIIGLQKLVLSTFAFPRFEAFAPRSYPAIWRNEVRAQFRLGWNCQGEGELLVEI